MNALDAIRAFLPCPTPEAWLDAARQQLPLLLVDHANCEKKAATSALNLLQRYRDDLGQLRRLARLAREELLHYEQVLGLMQRRGIAYRKLSASRYAPRLHAAIRHDEPGRPGPVNAIWVDVAGGHFFVPRGGRREIQWVCMND
jgi:tRNA-(ms[2]io[6]A)-hydroxylase